MLPLSTEYRSQLDHWGTRNMADDFSIEWLSGDQKLPTLPGIASRLLDAVNRDEPDVRAIASIIANDPPLTAELLRFANSPYFGFRNPITTVFHAAQMLGLKTVKNLALSFSLIKTFQKGDAPFDYSDFWRGSLTAAVSCKLIAKELLPDFAEDAFFLGLLHNIGILVLSERFPEDYREIRAEPGAFEAKLAVREHNTLGFNHMQVGAGLVEKWGLPECFFLPIAYHHCPGLLASESERLRSIIRILYLATLFADFFDSPEAELTYGAIHHYVEECGLGDRIEVDGLLQEAGERVVEVLPVFDIEGYDRERYQQLIEGAREALVQLSGKQTEELFRQRQEIENLRQTAVRDGLTSLYNHKWFHEMLQREIQRSSRYGKPLSLLIADIDDFKAVNDRYGHLVGDRVLRAVSSILKSDVRETDCIARYGGEEFGIICPETDLQGAINLGRRLLRSIGDHPFAHEQTPLQVTISIGIAALENGDRLEREELIDRADKALYTAKKGGKNRCCSYL